MTDNRLEIVLAAKEITGKAFATVENRLKNLSKSVFSFNAALGVAAGAAGLGYFVKKNLEAADSIAKIADSVGVSTTSLQEYRFMAERSGVATAQLDQGLGAFSKRLGELKAGSGALNTYLSKNNKELKNQLIAARSTDAALAIFLDHLGRIDDQSQKTALSAAAFSRTAGIKMTNLVAAGSKGLADMRKEFADLGLAIDEKWLRQSEKAVDQFTNLEYAIKTQLMGAVVQVSPQITAVAGNIVEWIKANDDFLKQNMPGYMDNLKLSMEGVLTVAGGVAGVLERIANTSKGAGLVAGGELSFFKLMTASPEELKKIIAEFDKKYELLLSGVPGQGVQTKVTPTPPPNPSPVPTLVTERTPFVNYDRLNLTDKERRMIIDPAEVEKTKVLLADMKNIVPKTPFVNYDKLNLTDKERRMIIDPAEVEKTKALLADMNQVTKKTFIDMSEFGTQAADDWTNAFDGWAADYARSLTQMVVDSNGSFGDITRSYAKMLMEMALQKKLVEPALTFGMAGIDSGISWLTGMFGGNTSSPTSAFASTIFNPSGVVLGMAGGGIINEHIIGRGLSTGRSYQFGEGGVPEAVVPKKDWGKGSGAGVNSAPKVQINISNNGGAVSAKQDGPLKWDGERWVLGVIMDAVHRNRGGFGNNLKTAMGR